MNWQPNDPSFFPPAITSLPMYKLEFCDRADWRHAVGWIHQDLGEESSRTLSALDTLTPAASQGKVGVVRESLSKQLIAGFYCAALPGGVVSIGAIRIDRQEVLKQVIDLLQCALSHYSTQNVELVQAIATEFSTLERRVLEGIGLRYLSHLDHLVLFLEGEKKASQKAWDAWESSGDKLSLTEYQDGRLAQLEDVITESYIDTLDCPLLGDIRTGKAAVEGYIAAREQRHSWWLAESGERVVGCLLLWERANAIWELTYMGIIPEVRGKKLGSILLEAAIGISSRLGAKQLVLSVDRENLPATRLYHQRGFYCYNSTEVWFGGGSLLLPQG